MPATMHETGDEPSSSTSHDDRCNVCAASCSIVPLLGSTAPLPMPVTLAATVFPDLPAPVARFLSDGPERPPRSL